MNACCIKTMYLLVCLVLFVTCESTNSLSEEGEVQERFKRSPQNYQSGTYPNYGSTNTAGQYPNYGSSSNTAGQYPNNYGSSSTNTAGQYPNYGSSSGGYPVPGSTNYGSSSGSYPNTQGGSGIYPNLNPGSTNPQYFPNGTRIPYPNTPGQGYQPGQPGYPSNRPGQPGYPSTNPNYGQPGYPNTNPSYGQPGYSNTNPNYGPSGYPSPNQGNTNTGQYPNYGTTGQQRRY